MSEDERIRKQLREDYRFFSFITYEIYKKYFAQEDSTRELQSYT